jgi:hypothetical protein
MIPSYLNANETNRAAQLNTIKKKSEAEILDLNQSITSHISIDRFGFMVFNVNNTSAILCWSVLLVKETGVPGEKH